jgi:hypothetical protein
MDWPAKLRARLGRAAATPAPQIVLIVLALGADMAWRGWLWVLPIIALVCFAAWLIARQRARTLADIPTSRIGSAAQGYVELSGEAKGHPGAPLLTPFRHLPCVWYECTAQEKRHDKWHTVEHARSDQTFLLHDDSGECVVDPEQAEVRTSHRETWTDDDRRYTEYLLLPRDRLYAIGAFATRNPIETVLNTKEDLGEVLAEWKQDKATLHARFDLNTDGMIDDAEWRLARAQAKREVEKLHREIRSAPGYHELSAPRDGRPFVISNFPQDQLISKFKRWALAHLLTMIASLIGWCALLAR